MRGLNSLRPYVSRLDANGKRVATINPLTGLPYPNPLNIQTFNAYTGFNKVRYHSLQVSMRRPFRQGLQLTGAYTLARDANFNRTYTVTEFQDRNWRPAGRTHVFASVVRLPAAVADGAGIGRHPEGDHQRLAGQRDLADLQRLALHGHRRREEINSQGVTQTADLVGPVVKLGHIGDPPQAGEDGVFGTSDDIAGCLVVRQPRTVLRPVRVGAAHGASGWGPRR